MQYKYKCFWLSKEEDDYGNFITNVYYNGILATSVKDCTEESSVRKAEEWVEDEGFYWLGVE